MWLKKSPFIDTLIDFSITWECASKSISGKKSCSSQWKSLKVRVYILKLKKKYWITLSFSTLRIRSLRNCTFLSVFFVIILFECGLTCLSFGRQKNTISVDTIKKITKITFFFSISTLFSHDISSMRLYYTQCACKLGKFYYYHCCYSILGIKDAEYYYNNVKGEEKKNYTCMKIVPENSRRWYDDASYAICIVLASNLCTMKSREGFFFSLIFFISKIGNIYMPCIMPVNKATNRNL